MSMSEQGRKLREVRDTLRELRSTMDETPKADSASRASTSSRMTLKEIRHALLLSQAEFAPIIEVATTTLSKIENNGQVSPVIARRIAEKLDVPLKDLNINIVPRKLR